MYYTASPVSQLLEGHLNLTELDMYQQKPTSE